MPSLPASSMAPPTPAAGPDSTSRCGSRAARSAGRTPPLDSITRSGASLRDADSPFRPAEVPLEDRPEAGGDRGRGRPRVLPELASHIR